MNHFIKQIKRVKLRELAQAWKFPISLICVPFYKRKHRDLWIVCEDKNEARDNGFWFYKYLREKHPEQECVYAIKKTSPDYSKVADIGNTVEFGSLKHWIYYFISTKKISSQKAGNPNAAIFYFLEVYGLYKNNRIFLQHGVIINELKWLYYDVTRFKRFICGGSKEFEFVKSTFGYPKDAVVYTGLCRFDGLHNEAPKEDEAPIILIMPTWREWIADEDYRLLQYEGTRNVIETEYFRSWVSFITDKSLEILSRKYGVKFVFFPHREMQKYDAFFPKSTSWLTIATARHYDVQDLMKKASMMVTDYSSVFNDMVYMKKPIAFFQFDYDKFRKFQYGEGYFDYRNNPFGKSFDKKEQVFIEIENVILNKFRVSEEYKSAHKEFFSLYDNRNCQRVYEVVQAL